jgi:hypothetical protein
VTGDDYVRMVLARHAVPRGPASLAELAASVAAGPIRNWAGKQLNSISFSGSYAKETAISGASDIDLFISLKSDTAGALKDIYFGLYEVASEQGWSPRAQNVSIGASIIGARVDLVPARVQAGYQNYHSLYVSKRSTWTQTNVALQTSTVVSSGRQNEIKALKVWRKLKGLDIPSLHLELFVIQALSGRSRDALAANVLFALAQMGSSFASTRIVDPSNTANVLSDDLSLREKLLIASTAARSAAETHWEGIIW